MGRLLEAARTNVKVALRDGGGTLPALGGRSDGKKPLPNRLPQSLLPHPGGGSEVGTR